MKNGKVLYILILIILSNAQNTFSQNSLLCIIAKYKGAKYCCFFEGNNISRETISNVTVNENIFDNFNAILGSPILPYINNSIDFSQCDITNINIESLPHLIRNCYLNPDIDKQYVLKIFKLKKKETKCFHNKSIEIIVLPYHIKCCEYTLSNPGLLSSHPYFYTKAKIIIQSENIKK